MSNNINFYADSDDTEGHPAVESGPPSAIVEDDDTAGHRIVQDAAPGISGALSVDPKTQG